MGICGQVGGPSNNNFRYADQSPKMEGGHWGAVGDPKNPDDAKDAEHLYSVLENSVIPTYYNNRNDWILMMKEAIKTGVDYTAHRMITEYNHKYYRVETIS